MRGLLWTSAGSALALVAVAQLEDPPLWLICALAALFLGCFLALMIRGDLRVGTHRAPPRNVVGWVRRGIEAQDQEWDEMEARRYERRRARLDQALREQRGEPPRAWPAPPDLTEDD